MKDRLIELMKFAKSIDSERVELQKDEYLFLLEFIEKLENENLILKQKRLTLWDRLEFVRMAREKAIKEFAMKIFSDLENLFGVSTEATVLAEIFDTPNYKRFKKKYLGEQSDE